MGLTNVLHLTLLAAQHVDEVLGLAVHTHVYVHTVVGLCGLDCLPRGDIRADWAVVALPHSWDFFLGLPGRSSGTLALINLSLIFGGLL